MPVDDATLAVRLGFVPPSVAGPDAARPGLLRAGPRAAAPYARDAVDVHECRATDTCRPGTRPPDLLEHGFAVVDLSPLDDLQAACARVRAAGSVTDDDAGTIRSALHGAVLRGAGGREVTVLFLAEEGFIMRTAGPDGMAVVGPRSQGMNGHGGATSVHSDQDVFGTPLTQLMDGRAPSLFRHDSPDGHNHDAGLMLVNLWIPLQQITQPLVLADGRSIDRRRHQLRYGLATDSFLDREDDMAVNDIWTYLHDPGQRWYLRSEMDHREAYLFDTLSTPHGAGTLPGEDVAARCHRALEAAEADVAGGAIAALVDAVEPARRAQAPPDTPRPLVEAVEAMAAVADEAGRDPAHVCGDGAEAWLDRSRRARQRVVRMSLEMRVVVSLDA
ncbi:hypothetical protein PO878_04875 [Iamia majanohamensis]|uniref:Uncharacterized protein n=1 Tax=Iamia majanohamensis TaxID=467976 RepID=A0AAE9Y950_9ACTN|nr:hypothetical protein [Iamia majanohamensis]WCO68056.1 hypothetical protein PO878_04875 [Iamia majanohamensis]